MQTAHRAAAGWSGVYGTSRKSPGSGQKINLRIGQQMDADKQISDNIVNTIVLIKMHLTFRQIKLTIENIVTKILKTA